MKDRERIAREREALDGALMGIAVSFCTANGVESLSVVIRLVVEFNEYLGRTMTDETESGESQYVCGSVFSGMDSFDTFAHTYKVLKGSELSRIGWGSIDSWEFEAVRRKYLEMYEELLRGGTFQRGYRLLLDLFKLQIIWAGIEYSW